MSVQIRRRREMASFLASFVGAQAELLVDTTNNRVQVHDGTTPGGWPAAGLADLTARNLLVNGAFAINQRAYVSGTALAAGAYGHDRWKAGSGGGTYTFTAGVPDTAVTVTAGTLVQAVEAPNVVATAVWLSWQGTAMARIWQGTASGSFAAGTPRTVAGTTVNTLYVGGLTAGTVLAVEFSTGTLGLVQLEAALPNAGPTRYERRPIATEQQLCARTYQRIAFPTGAIVLDQYYGGASNCVLSFPIPPMRATPTVAATGIVFSNGSAITTSATASWAALLGSTSAAGRVTATASGSPAFVELSAEI